MQVETGVRSEDVLQGAKHVLFVEGAGDESLDVKVLNELLDRSITISPLGPSYSVKSVAQALYPYHPAYYFLIDRDPHHDDDFVNRCWDNFPDPDTHNLLVWRRREIENYFIDPAYLVNSEYRRVEKGVLEAQLVDLASRRVYLDAANWVIVGLREGQKRNWIDVFRDSDLLPSAEVALEQLKGRPEYIQRVRDVGESLAEANLERRFAETLQKMTAGAASPTMGRGDWMDMVQGKKVFAQLVNSTCFSVRTRAGTPLQGQEKSHEIVKNLLRQDISMQPPDFQRLKTLIQQRIHSK